MPTADVPPPDVPPPDVPPPDVPPGARRVEVDGERLARWLDGFADRHGGVHTTATADVVHLVGADGDRAWLTVPFPPLRGPLAEHVLRPRRVGVVLVRRGGWAVGVVEGAGLTASRVGTGYVQGTTKAGGWSQQRYARRRDNQAAALHGRAADVAARLLDATVLDALVGGGDRTAVAAVLADPRLAAVRALPAGPWLAVPDPRQRVLEAVPAQLRRVSVALVP